MLNPLTAALTACNKTHSGVLPQLRTLKAAEADKLVRKHETVCRWKSWPLTLASGTLRFETTRAEGIRKMKAEGQSVLKRTATYA